jgi:hypothetical protein
MDNDDFFQIHKDDNKLLILQNERNFNNFTLKGEYLEHKNVSYKPNSHGWRGPDFSENTKALILGCSQTFGVGLPEEKTWPHLLFEKTKLPFVNLAFPGDSIVAQVRKSFHYFKTFGHPEVIVGLFPFFRMEIPLSPKNLWPSHIERESYEQKTYNVEVFAGDKPKYVKLPFNPSSVFTQEVTFYYSHMLLFILEQYCVSHNIQFIWGSWEKDYDKSYHLIDKIDKDVYKNFCNLGISDWERVVKNNKLEEFIPNENKTVCHLEYENDFFFHHGSDVSKGLEFSHFGFHKNIHIAESFYKHWIEKL